MRNGYSAELDDAIGVIESVAGFTDDSTAVGEAWAVVLSHLASGEKREELVSMQAGTIKLWREENERLRLTIQQMHKDYGCELMDPNGTIWEHATRLQKENERLREENHVLKQGATEAVAAATCGEQGLKVERCANSAYAPTPCSRCLSETEIRNGHRVETFDDRPRSWKVEYEDGADGCLPSGWYAEGLDTHGFKITAPIYQEYGPFGTEEEALAYIRLVDASYRNGGIQ